VCQSWSGEEDPQKKGGGGGAKDERPTIYKYFRKRFVVWPKVEVEEEEENLTRN